MHDIMLLRAHREKCVGQENECMKKHYSRDCRLNSASKHHVKKFLAAGKERGWKTREEMAKWLRVSVRTVDYWTEDGTLPALKKGRIVRYDLEVCATALKDFLTKCAAN